MRSKYGYSTVKIMSIFCFSITVPLPLQRYRYRSFHPVTNRFSPLLQRYPPLIIVSNRFLSYFHRFLPFHTIVFLPEIFGNKKSEKHIKNTKQSNKKNNKNTVSVFGFSHGYSRDPLAIIMRRYLSVT